MARAPMCTSRPKISRSLFLSRIFFSFCFLPFAALTRPILSVFQLQLLPRFDLCRTLHSMFLVYRVGRRRKHEHRECHVPIPIIHSRSRGEPEKAGNGIFSSLETRVTIVRCSASFCLLISRNVKEKMKVSKVIRASFAIKSRT